jgi:dihydrofolate synthase/folylpolyglutamate synthase
MVDGLTPYRRALDYLFVRTTGAWRFGLDRTLALLDLLGNPHRRFPVVHVGGTNGKGSVCAMIERALLDRGFRVGKYTSPHLVDFRERILLDGAPVAEEAIVEFVETWTQTIERLGATFFEATTAMALDFFARGSVDIAVVEVGLGGRLDATNVVDPLVAVVTNVALDHAEYLGSTLEEIAAEKAGIFKPDRPVVIGDADSRMAARLEDHARRAGAGPIRCAAPRLQRGSIVVTGDGTDFRLDDGNLYRVSLRGAHQALNAATALVALDALSEPWHTGFRNASHSLLHVRLAGRVQRRGMYIFDVAHNPDGAAALAATLRAMDVAKPLVAVVCVLDDKDWRGILANIGEVVEAFVLTDAPSVPANRAWDATAAFEYALSRGWRVALERDFDVALASAERDAASVLVTGSFHTVGDAMARLHVNPLGR